jgi:hypothetical protein
MYVQILALLLICHVMALSIDGNTIEPMLYSCCMVEFIHIKVLVSHNHAQQLFKILFNA